MFSQRGAVTGPSDGVSPCVSITELDSHGPTEDSSSGLLQFREPPPPPPDPQPPARHSSPSPPRRMYVPRAGPGLCGRGRGHRRGLGRGHMFEDPAVMRIVQGRPSLKVTQSFFVCKPPPPRPTARPLHLTPLPVQGLDSAIVDCGKAMYWNSFEDDVSFHVDRLSSLTLFLLCS